ncbi:hypothetical protein [Nocardioides sp. 503]|uniref:hypothetical protein n=1 Tax=Nocardioides sp. 503 TaxID=2508326 RepID=UPI00106F93BC|nr:hypothetical protein [Nocardioides sp. 503]
MSWSKRFHSLAALAVLMLVVALHPTAASAHPSGVSPDNKNHVWCFGTTTDDNPNVRAAQRYAMDNLEAQTEFYGTQQAECGTATDVQFRAGDGGQAGDERGAWRCVTYNPSSGICGKAIVTLWPEVIAAEAGPFLLNLNKTACHEVGHSVGQTHHDPPYGDCLVRGPVSTGHVQYGGVHKGYINDLF